MSRRYRKPMVPFFEFLDGCTKYFTTEEKALAALKRVGKPPSSPDITDPSAKLQIALRSIAAIATPRSQDDHYAPKVAFIKNHWATLVPWIKFFMEGVVALDDDTHIMSPSNFHDRVCFVLPALLTYPTRCVDSRAEVSDLQSRIAELRRLAIQVWLKIMDGPRVEYIMLLQWTILFESVFWPTHEGFAEALSDVAIEDQEDKVASILIRFINRVTRRIKNMEVDADEISDHKANLTQISLYIQKGVTNLRFLTRGGCYSLVKLFVASTQRRLLSQLLADHEHPYEHAIDVAVAAAMMLRSSIVGPMWASDTLDAGIVMVMFKASDLHDAPLGAIKRIYHALAEVLKRLARYVVYSSVLIRFCQVMKKLDREGLEDEFPEEMKFESQFWEVWEQTRDMADDFRGIFKGLKNQEAPEYSMCGYKLCFLKVEEKSGPAGIKHLSCSRCHTVQYCSKKCATANWKVVHRRECPNMAGIFKGGTPHPTTRDYAFFKVLLKCHMLHHSSQICDESNLTLLTHAGASFEPPKDPELRTFVCVPFTGDTTRQPWPDIKFFNLKTFRRIFRDVFAERQYEELKCALEKTEVLTVVGVGLFHATAGLAEEIWAVSDAYPLEIFRRQLCGPPDDTDSINDEDDKSE